MPHLVQFKSPRLLDEYCSGKIDERLLILLRALALKFGGIRITCLIRTEEENAALVMKGASPHSKHKLNPKTGLCEAADINPPTQKEQEGDKWRKEIANYVQRNFRGIDIVIQLHGTAAHAHIEIDPPPGLNVEIV